MDIRKGNTIMVKWSVKTNGEEESLIGRNLSLFLSTYSYNEEITEYIINDNVILFKFQGVDQTKLGRYTLTLYENYGLNNQSVVDACNAFNLVAKTCNIKDTSVDDNLEISQIELESEIKLIIGGDFSNEYVRFSEQDLTDEQKQQVLLNLGIQNLVIFANENDVEL